jgi:plasmid maintenance system antidote protein VapI
MTEKLQNQYVPDYVTPPGETLEEILVSIGMTKAGLSDRIGKTPKHVGDIVKHGAPITPQTAMDLEKALGIAPAIVIGRLQHEGYIPHSHFNGLRRRLEATA